MVFWKDMGTCVKNVHQLLNEVSPQNNQMFFCCPFSWPKNYGSAVEKQHEIRYLCVDAE